MTGLGIDREGCAPCEGRGYFPSKTGADAFQCNYCNGHGSIPVNRKDLETEILAKVADKIMGGVKP